MRVEMRHLGDRVFPVRKKGEGENLYNCILLINSRTKCKNWHWSTIQAATIASSFFLEGKIILWMYMERDREGKIHRNDMDMILTSWQMLFSTCFLKRIS
jgi:hypothetical protein